ncbi:hypothetical protein JCM17844_24740 [Iodidimonas gelatinilytica]|uniref:Uncharacterized protein n=1 Tax=Iodidimonas gelatinilytica TaxID=1236966 RepID=A0A5A7MSC9_9PROT|nr:hypothetical protein JCM17844_24740 [Iodidimonas gelatinilytica]
MVFVLLLADFAALVMLAFWAALEAEMAFSSVRLLLAVMLLSLCGYIRKPICAWEVWEFSGVSSKLFCSAA